MSVFVLPPELIYDVLVLCDWQDVLSFVSTSKHIIDCVVSKSDIARLRQRSHRLLLAWEQAETKRQGWTTWPEPERNDPSEWRERWIDTWPCYTCLRKLPDRWVSSNVKGYRKGFGQVDASKRMCIPCGIRTGFYKPRSRTGYYGVCTKCRRQVDMYDGYCMDPVRLVKLEPLKRLEPGDKAALERDLFMWPQYREHHYWWNYTHECIECVVDAGCTERDLYSHRLRRAALEKDYRVRYKRGMLIAMNGRQTRGREIRTRLGLREPGSLPDISALRLSNEAFPNYKQQQVETEKNHEHYPKLMTTIDVLKDRNWWAEWSRDLDEQNEEDDRLREALAAALPQEPW